MNDSEEEDSEESAAAGGSSPGSEPHWDALVPGAPSEPVSVPTIVCWRCSKFIFANQQYCPFCEADLPPYLPQGGTSASAPLESTWPALPPLPDAAPAARLSAYERLLRERAASRTIIHVLLVFAVLQITSIVFFTVCRLLAENNHADFEHSALVLTGVAEGIDSLVVLAALILLPRLPRRKIPFRMARRGWIAALPLLVLALILNGCYFWLLRWFLQTPDWLRPEHINDHHLGWSILLTCIQPAIIEELFFRYLVLGNLREFMGDHGAIWVSSIMFGMAHIGNPLAIPILMVVGATFGYARVYSNSMIPPMLMHCLHNGMILILEQSGW
ncbi:MAG TPA: CPBP family intramembrane glutamic endopeptidase [Pirellulales bacterium]|nr:CPBP family intramembrane glutamic endopeptidase [Pirellulales bacterium]